MSGPSAAIPAVDASPSHYAFPFEGTPIVDTELQPMPTGSAVRHGSMEQGDRTGNTGNAWWQRIPGVGGASRDPTPHNSPRGVMRDPSAPRSQLMLPASAHEQRAMAEEEPTSSPLVGVQLLRLQKEGREFKTQLNDLNVQLKVSRELIDSLQGRLITAEGIIEERFQQTVGVTETHSARLTALEETLQVMRTFGGVREIPQGVPAPAAQSPATSEQRYNQATAAPSDPAQGLARHYNMAINDGFDSPLNPGTYTRQYPRQYGQQGGYQGGMASAMDMNDGAFTPYKWAIVSHKIPHSFSPYDGLIEHYDAWYDRFRNHAANTNPAWVQVLDLIQATPTPITRASVSQIIAAPPPAMNGVEMDWNWLNTHLWTTLAYFVTDSVLGRRLQYTQGQEWCGMEWWRVMYVEGKGGSEKLTVHGQTAFHTFPKCSKPDRLQMHVGEWQVQRMKWGIGISDAQLKIMLVSTLPDAIQADIRRRPEVQTLRNVLDYIAIEVSNLRDEQMLKLQSQRMSQHAGGSTSRGASALIPDDSATMQAAPTAPDAPINADVMREMTDMITAAIQRQPAPRPKAKPKAKAVAKSRLGRPDPKFVGCWHCGDSSHSRRTCPAFQKILKDNNGKVPESYKGKYEHSVKKVVNALTTEDDLEAFYLEEEGRAGEEDEEEYQSWALRTQISHKPARDIKSCLKTRCHAFVPTVVSNSFDAIDNDGDDDEDDMIRALSTISSNVTVGPKVTQRQMQRRQKAKTTRQISQIAAAVNSGKYGLPDLPELDDDDYYAVWALVDSGAGISCANKRKHFPGARPIPSTRNVILTTANGHRLRGRGEFCIDALTSEGHKTKNNFVDADVEMPILSVSQICEGKRNDVGFDDEGGAITNLKSGRVTRFIERQGVYFLVLIIKKTTDEDGTAMDFVRPVAPA